MEESALDHLFAKIKEHLENNNLKDAIKLLEEIQPADQADFIEELDSKDQLALIRRLDPSDSADMFEELEDDVAVTIADQMRPKVLAGILDEMESDEAADVLSDIDPELALKTLNHMDEAEEIKDLMQYAPDTAGGLMTSSVVPIRANWTAHRAIQEVKQIGSKSDSSHYLFVLDPEDKLVGVAGLRDIVIAEEDTPVADLMGTKVISVHVNTDQEECAQVLSRYSYLAIPVIDDDKKFLGVITADDLIEVAVEEGTEDLFKMVGISSSDENVFTPPRFSVVKRLPWLAINMVTLFIAITVVDAFESVIAGMVVLAVFLPLVSGEGGNAGSQTTTVIVRGLSLGEISLKDSRKALTKEIIVSLLNGFIIGLGTAVIVQLWKGDWRISLALMLAMILNFLLAAIAGVLVPITLKKFNVDPALASAAFVTSVTDTFGFLFFLGIVALII
ncbi:MAG: magnesium transporter [Candidatus Heimdallarchaeota archaeon]|nr:magnesium transporter [Candidatus Heimdallarchaeota archaeon]